MLYAGSLPVKDHPAQEPDPAIKADSAVSARPEHAV
jgi:hypothetical protein